MIAVQYQGGVFLPEHDLWLDPWQAKPLAFVSHAHSDHIARHDQIIVSERTARLMQARLPGKRREHVLPFGQSSRLRDLTVTLLPAGHIFGSAQFFAETESGSLLYTGDFKLRPGRSAEPAEWRKADTLIMETTYGRPRYRFPPSTDVVRQIVAFCHETLEEEAVPVLLGYSLGKAQEILCSISDAGLVPMLHGAVYQMTHICETLGHVFGPYQRYRANALAGKVLICPPSANRSPMLERIPRKRVAMISGWALDPGANFRYRVDAVFPLSDHADYDDLLRYVELVQPKRVLTLHGFAAEFARDLRERGLEAWALSGENQLELSLRSGFKIFRPSGDPESKIREMDSHEDNAIPAETDSEFRTLGMVGNAIAATPAKLEKVRLLAQYLETLGPEELPIATTYFSGKAFSQSDPRTLQVGWAVIFRALIAATKMTESEFREIARTHGDASKTALEVLTGRTSPQPFGLVQSRQLFEKLHQTRGPIGKTELLRAHLEKLSPLEGQYLVKILTGDARIGLREGLMEEAIASAFNAPLDQVREANMLLGDIGETARLASQAALERAELSLFRPIKCMLASPEESAEGIWARFSVNDRTHPEPSPVSAANATPPAEEQQSVVTIYVEDKFDGVRSQLHRSSAGVKIFSRDLRNVTDQFSEIAEHARKFSDDLILDGEIIAFEQGKKLTFFDLQKRLGRKDDGMDLFSVASANVPVIFVAFDLLWLNGQSLLKRPLRNRRELLRGLHLPPRFQISDVVPAHSAKEIELAFRDARLRSNEGLMIKDPESFYAPGRRGMYWFKLKKELATLDVVVVAAELGHGKRNHVLSDYTFAVRDEDTGKLLPIGKAYSGLTDVEIAQLTEHFKQNTIVDRGRYREVKPDIVLEVAFNSIQPSNRHASGLALRFPRIKAIRRDKTVAEIDTLAYARKLAAESSGTSPD